MVKKDFAEQADLHRPTRTVAILASLGVPPEKLRALSRWIYSVST